MASCVRRGSVTVRDHGTPSAVAPVLVGQLRAGRVIGRLAWPNGQVRRRGGRPV